MAYSPSIYKLKTEGYQFSIRDAERLHFEVFVSIHRFVSTNMRSGPLSPIASIYGIFANCTCHFETKQTIISSKRNLQPSKYYPTSRPT